MLFENDSVVLIEEFLDKERTNVVCQHIMNVSQQIWCVSLRKCFMHESEFQKLLKTIRQCKEIKYINLNLNQINTLDRLTQLNSVLPHLRKLDTLW